VSSGTYLVDVPAAGSPSYLAIPRTVDGSDIWVGASVDLGPAATAPGFDGGLQVSGYADGALSDECWFSEASVVTDTSDGGDTPRLETRLWHANREPACRTAASITLAIDSYQWSPPAGSRVQLTVWEEPPATGTEGLQTPSRTVTWGNLGAPGEPNPVRAGTTWSDAPDISSGTWAFHLDPGTTGVFRMPLDRGQHGQVLISTKDRATAYDAVTTFWASPQGGALSRPQLPAAPASEFGLDLRNGPAVQAIATPVVNWRNRDLAKGFGGINQTGVPGTYYFVVSLARKGIPAKGVDFTFQSGYFTDYAVGAPTYQPEAPAVPQVATFDEDQVAASSSSDAGDPGTSDGGVPWPVVSMLFGGAAIFGVLGVAALNRNRRGRP
jgi:hypothetical protein